MSLESIYYVGQTIAVVAILASLVFVGIQVKQSSRAQRQANEQAIADSVSESNTQFMSVFMALASDETLAGIYTRALAGEDLNRVEATRFVAFVNTFFAYGEALYNQHKIQLGFGFVEHPNDAIAHGAPFLARLLAVPAAREWWHDEAVHYYSPEYHAATTTAVGRFEAQKAADIENVTSDEGTIQI